MRARAFCAKYAPCSTSIPEELDNDIYLVKFKGKGRGGGFEAYDHQSIMGDDFYTPFFYEQTIEMLKALRARHGVVPDHRYRFHVDFRFPAQLPPRVRESFRGKLGSICVGYEQETLRAYLLLPVYARALPENTIILLELE